MNARNDKFFDYLKKASPHTAVFVAAISTLGLLVNSNFVSKADSAKADMELVAKVQALAIKLEGFDSNVNSLAAVVKELQGDNLRVREQSIKLVEQMGSSAKAMESVVQEQQRNTQDVSTLKSNDAAFREITNQLRDDLREVRRERSGSRGPKAPPDERVGPLSNERT